MKIFFVELILDFDRGNQYKCFGKHCVVSFCRTPYFSCMGHCTAAALADSTNCLAPAPMLMEPVWLPAEQVFSVTSAFYFIHHVSVPPNVSARISSLSSRCIIADHFVPLIVDDASCSSDASSLYLPRKRHRPARVRMKYKPLSHSGHRQGAEGRGSEQGSSPGPPRGSIWVCPDWVVIVGRRVGVGGAE